jgi:PAS domain S-box-containing protein
VIANKRRLQLYTSATLLALVLSLGLAAVTYTVGYLRSTMERQLAEDSRIIGENLRIIISQVTREYAVQNTALAQIQRVLQALGDKGWIGFACVLDKQGRVLAHPRIEALDMQVPLNRYEPSDLLGTRSPSIRELPGLPGRRDAAIYRTEADIIAVQWLPAMMTYLCVHQSLDQVDRVVGRLRTRLVLIGFIFLAALGAGSWTFVGSLVERYESNLARSEARNRALVANSSPILVTDDSGAILDANPQAESLLGLPVEAIKQKTSADFWPRGKQDQLTGIFEELRDSGTVERLDLDLCTASGRTVPVDLRACIIAFGDRDAVYFLIRDVTETRRAREEILEANRRLRELDHLKTDFLNTVSHELRTPLTSIKWSAESLASMLKGQEDPNLERLLTIIGDDNQRLSALIEQLLSFSSFDAGRLEVSRQEVDLDAAVRRAMDEVSPIADRKGVAVALVEGEPAGPLSGDPEQLHQVLVNVLDNAVKYTPSGGRVSVTIMPLHAAVAITVNDTGIGIPERDIPLIFDKFYRAEDPLVRQERGTGIGLAVVRGIVDAHGGQVDVESAEGRGTTFTIRLPRSL